MGISLRLDFIERSQQRATPLRTSSNPSKMQTFHKIALLFACVALCASQNQAQEVPDKAVCEADVDDCVSSNTAFKCAMMFKNLTDLPLKVLDIIPDLIAQNDDPEITAELEKKEISFEAFEIDDVCPAPGVTGGQRLKQINQAKKRANARCYAFLSDYASSSLSSCDLGLVANKDSKAETVGDVLCERATTPTSSPPSPNSGSRPSSRSAPTSPTAAPAGRRSPPAASTSSSTRSSAACATGRAGRSSTGPATDPRGPRRSAPRSLSRWRLRRQDAIYTPKIDRVYYKARQPRQRTPHLFRTTA